MGLMYTQINPSVKYNFLYFYSFHCIINYSNQWFSQYRDLDDKLLAPCMCDIMKRVKTNMNWINFSVIEQ